MTFFRSLVSLLLLMLLGNLWAAEETDAKTEWHIDFNTALEEAQKNQKQVLIYFSGSDWCRPCILLKKEVFDTDTFRNYAADHYVLLQLDFPARKKNRLPEAQLKHNENLAERYNKSGAFPRVVIVDGEEKVRAEAGYQKGGPQAYIDHLNKLLGAE